MWRQGAEGATEVRGFTLALTYNMKHTTVATKYDIFGEFRATWEMIMYNVILKKSSCFTYFRLKVNIFISLMKNIHYTVKVHGK